MKRLKEAGVRLADRYLDEDAIEGIEIVVGLITMEILLLASQLEKM